jgi:hypothetical protein
MRACSPPEQHTSDKGRRLATTYVGAMRDLSTKVYHCMPWVEVKRNGIGFYKPKHLEGDYRYLSINLYIDQQPSPEFAAFTIEERASRMFSRYVGPMLKRMARPSALLADKDLDGFTVILEWLKQVPQTASARPVHETIAVFLERPTVVDYIGGRLPARDLAARSRACWPGTARPRWARPASPPGTTTSCRRTRSATTSSLPASPVPDRPSLTPAAGERGPRGPRSLFPPPRRRWAKRSEPFYASVPAR